MARADNPNIEIMELAVARLGVLLKESRFLEALPGHMPGDAASQARVPKIVERLKAIVATR